MKIPFFSSRQPQNLFLYNLKVSPCCQPVNKQVYCPEHKHGADRKCSKQPCIIHAEDGQQAAHGGKCYDNMDNRHTQGKKKYHHDLPCDGVLHLSSAHAHFFHDLKPLPVIVAFCYLFIVDDHYRGGNCLLYTSPAQAYMLGRRIY